MHLHPLDEVIPVHFYILENRFVLMQLVVVLELLCFESLVDIYLLGIELLC